MEAISWVRLATKFFQAIKTLILLGMGFLSLCLAILAMFLVIFRG
jgi:hypothetical protein